MLTFINTLKSVRINTFQIFIDKNLKVHIFVILKWLKRKQYKIKNNLIVSWPPFDISPNKKFTYCMTLMLACCLCMGVHPTQIVIDLLKPSNSVWNLIYSPIIFFDILHLFYDIIMNKYVLMCNLPNTNMLLSCTTAEWWYLGAGGLPVVNALQTNHITRVITQYAPKLSPLHSA